ncbi:hypothetical protein FB45DRAFT_236109 [Roridomyces roridus]|uniref:Uncharacterized protein n=1 Tax=Roridomyces roridus TaxID=1738132 RepID=A0AAD7BBL1_9AGAR|nr:hypothetical protein FB45DRAFT_236109 [Roridomyces roridus]
MSLLFFFTLVVFRIVIVQADSADVDGSPAGSGSSLAKVGIIIGCTLLGLALLGLAIYGIERRIARRRAQKWGNIPKFAPLHTDLDELERGRYDASGDPNYESKSILLAGSPSPSASVFSFEEDEGQYIEFDPYDGHESRTQIGAFYPETPSPSPSPRLPDSARNGEKLESLGSPVDLHAFSAYPATPLNLHLAPPRKGSKVSRQESGSSAQLGVPVPPGLLPGRRHSETSMTLSRATSTTLSVNSTAGA